MALSAQKTNSYNPNKNNNPNQLAASRPNTLGTISKKPSVMLFNEVFSLDLKHKYIKFLALGTVGMSITMISALVGIGISIADSYLIFGFLMGLLFVISATTLLRLIKVLRCEYQAYKEKYQTSLANLIRPLEEERAEQVLLILKHLRSLENLLRGIDSMEINATSKDSNRPLTSGSDKFFDTALFTTYLEAATLINAIELYEEYNSTILSIKSMEMLEKYSSTQPKLFNWITEQLASSSNIIDKEVIDEAIILFTERAKQISYCRKMGIEVPSCDISLSEGTLFDYIQRKFQSNSGVVINEINEKLGDRAVIELSKEIKEIKSANYITPEIKEILIKHLDRENLEKIRIFKHEISEEISMSEMIRGALSSYQSNYVEIEGESVYFLEFLTELSDEITQKDLRARLNIWGDKHYKDCKALESELKKKIFQGSPYSKRFDQEYSRDTAREIKFWHLIEKWKEENKKIRSEFDEKLILIKEEAMSEINSYVENIRAAYINAVNNINCYFNNLQRSTNLAEIIEKFKEVISNYEAALAEIKLPHPKSPDELKGMKEVALDYFRHQCIELLQNLPGLEKEGWVRQISEPIIGASNYQNIKEESLSVKTHAKILKRSIKPGALKKAKVMVDGSSQFIPVANASNPITLESNDDKCKDYIIKVLKIYEFLFDLGNITPPPPPFHQAANEESKRGYRALKYQEVKKYFTDPNMIVQFQEFIHFLGAKINNSMACENDKRSREIRRLISRLKSLCTNLINTCQGSDLCNDPSLTLAKPVNAAGLISKSLHIHANGS